VPGQREDDQHHELERQSRRDRGRPDDATWTAVDDRRANQRAGDERRERDGRAQRPFGIRLAERKSEQNGVAGHGRRHHLPQAEKARGVDATGGHREQREHQIARRGGPCRGSFASRHGRSAHLAIIALIGLRPRC
jgi:hypothetical protein